MRFLIIPSTITILIPSLDRYLDYLEANNETAKQLEKLTAELNASSGAVQDSLDAAGKK